MKYYEIDYRSFTDRDDYKKRKSIGDANGEFVPDGRVYFDRMGKGEIIEDAPVFDYFHLQSFDKQQYWERCLQDVHGFIGEYPTGGHWYFSDKCKQVFEQFNIAKGFHFYPTKLLYKGTKLDYWIFQYVANDNGMNHEFYIDYAKSEFLDADKNAFTGLDEIDNIIIADSKLGRETQLTNGQKPAKSGVGSKVEIRSIEKTRDIYDQPLPVSNNQTLIKSGSNFINVKFLEIHGNGLGAYNSGGIK